ncbi:MAG: YjgP/YjgQ family permease [Treponema sp.]|nr:YjgP/YjgQ family permease [Treponema sp.]
MKLISFILKKFVPVFLFALIFFSVILNVVDLLMNLWKYIQMEVPVKVVLRIMLLYTPKTVWYSVPLAILFGSAYCLSQLYASNEMLAVFASGVSLLRFTLPMLIFSFIMTFALFFFDDKVVVKAYAEKTRLQNQALDTKVNSSNTNVGVISEGGKLLYFVREYNEPQKKLYNTYLVFRDDEKYLEHIVYASDASWDSEKEKWILSNVIQYDYIDKALLEVPFDDTLSERINEPCETFRRDNVSIENVNVQEAKAYIDHLKRAGLPYNEELSQYYKKFAFPFIVFIVVFLSIGLTGRTKKNVLLVSLASSVSAAVLFYVTQMLTMLMAQYGYISAFAGAWFPVIIFTAASIVLLRFSRT